MVMRTLAPLLGVIFSALSMAFLIVSIIEIFRGNEETGLYFLVAAVALTCASWLTSRSVRTAREVPVIRSFRVITEVSCEACGFREVREFREGDYIFKEVGACPKCGGKLVITSIYREEAPPTRRG